MSEHTPIAVRLTTIIAWLAFAGAMFWMFSAAYAEDPSQSALAAVNAGTFFWIATRRRGHSDDE